MTKVEEFIAKQIGDLTLANIKHRAMIDAMGIALAAKDAEIAELKAQLDKASAEPPLPLTLEKGNGDARAH